MFLNQRANVSRSPGVTFGDVMAAIEAARQAEDRFNYTTEAELIDAATLEVTAARIRLNHLIRQAKMERGIAQRGRRP